MPTVPIGTVGTILEDKPNHPELRLCGDRDAGPMTVDLSVVPGPGPDSLVRFSLFPCPTPQGVLQPLGGFVDVDGDRRMVTRRFLGFA